MTRNSAKGGPRLGRGEHRLHDPFAYPRLVLYRAIETNVSSIQVGTGSRVLDFGCGQRPYRALIPDECDYIGADLPGNPLADLPIVDGRVELPDGSVDLVLSTQ